MCEARGPGRSAVGRPPESKNRPRHGLTAARGAESRTDGPRRARRGPNQWLPPSCAGANQGRGGCFRRVGARQKSLRDIRAIRPPAQWAAAANGRATAPAAHPRGGQGRTSSDRVGRPCARRGGPAACLPPVYPLYEVSRCCYAFFGAGEVLWPRRIYSFQWGKAVAASEAGPRRPVRSGWRGVEPRGGVGRSSGQHTRREKEPCAKPVVPGVFGQPSWVCAWWQSSTQCPRGPVYTALTKALHFWQGFSVHVEGGPNITH